MTLIQNKTFGMIVNQNGGKVKSGTYNRKEFEAILKDDGLIIETKSIKDICPALMNFKKNNVSVLFIYGGDGTQQKVISEIIRLKINFLFVVPLKGGTMNMLVKDVGLGKPPIKVIRSIRSIYSANMPFFKKSIIRVLINSADCLYGFYFANGVIYKILKRYYEDGACFTNALKVTIQGILGSILTSHTYSRLFEPVGCRVVLDDKEINKIMFLGIMFGTLNRLVFGFRPFIEQAKENNEFNFIAYSFDRKKLIRYFPYLARGKMVDNLDIYPKTVKKLTLETNSGFALDGEVYNIDRLSKFEIDIIGHINIPIIS